jgi:hypothetical protein
MTVRLTPIESDDAAPADTPAMPVQAPPAPTDLPLAMAEPDDPAGDLADTAPSGEPVDATDHDEVNQDLVTDSRIALREARRTRRRTAWVCAAVVALALALTIAVVSLARTRPTSQSKAVPTAFLSSFPSASMLARAPAAPVPFPGTTVSEGGTP